MLGHQARALEDLLEVALGQPLTLGDHAEAVRPRRLGRTGVFEDLLGLHHRVHRGLGLGEARLGAEAAVLGAAARLGVDQRAHVGRVGELLHAGLPGPLHERLDLGVVLDLAQGQGFLAGDERWHRGGTSVYDGGTADDTTPHVLPFARLAPAPGQLCRSCTERSRAARVGHLHRSASTARFK